MIVSGHPACETRGADEPLIDGFCDALWLEDGLARTTLDSYRSDLLLLQRLLPRAAPVTQASEAELAQALADFSRTHKRTSQARLLSTLRRFYGWLVVNGRRSDDPSLKLARPARSSRLPKVISEAHEARRPRSWRAKLRASRSVSAPIPRDRCEGNGYSC